MQKGALVNSTTDTLKY